MKMFNNRNHLSDQLYMFFCPLKFESDYFVNGTATACKVINDNAVGMTLLDNDAPVWWCVWMMRVAARRCHCVLGSM